MRGSVGAACPFSPPAGRRCRQADEGRVTANANVSAYGFDPKDPSASLATAGYRCRHSGVSPRRAGQQEICACRSRRRGEGICRPLYSAARLIRRAKVAVAL
ncbi:hypothetical protein CN214_18020 [Sinorhizobium meliloti]|nr:hypothetical protein CN214_18020 [Sinorhizobium meliloti]